MAYIGRDIQYGVLDKQSFTADSSTTAFSLNSGVKNAKSLLVSVGGIIQEPDVAYTASGTTLTFSAAPLTGDVVYAIYLGKTLESGGAREQITFQNETGDGTTTPFTLSAKPVNAQSIMVTLNGVTQVPETDYTVDGTTITFTTAPVIGMGILVYHLGSAAAIGEVADASVTNAKIVGMDASKLTGSLPANTVSNTSIVSMDASKLTGTLPSSMEVDTSAIDQTIASLGMHVAVADNKASFNMPGVFIDQFEDDSGILTETDVDRDTTNEYVSSISEVVGNPTALTHTSIAGDTITFINNSVNGHSEGSMNTPYQLDGDWSQLFAVNPSNPGNYTWYWGDPSTSNTVGAAAGFVIDYASNLTFTSFKMHRNTTAGEVMSFRLQYSDDNSNWTNFDLTGSTFAASPELTSAGHPDNIWSTSTKDANGIFSTNTAGSSGQTGGSLWTPATPFSARYIRFEVVSWANRGNANVGWAQFIPTIQTTTTTTNATGTLISKASTADAAVSSTSGVMVYEDADGTSTLGTDLKVHFSSDDGANWTEAASYGTPINFNGPAKKMVKLGKTTLANTGTAVKMKAEWANQVAGTGGSGTTKTISAVGDAQHSTTQNKIGASSIKFDGSGDKLTVSGHSDFNFGTDNWTFECWCYLDSNTSGEIATLAHPNFRIFLASSRIKFVGGGIDAFLESGNSISTSTWTHLAVVRNGNTVTAYVDGTARDSSQTASDPSNSGMGHSTNDLTMGHGDNWLNGYLDEIRISNVARYTSNFTPSTTAFTSDANTVLLIHSDTTNTSTTFTDSSLVAGTGGKVARLHGWAVNY